MLAHIEDFTCAIVHCHQSGNYKIHFGEERAMELQCKFDILVLMKADGKTRASYTHGQQLNAHAESIGFLNATSIAQGPMSAGRRLQNRAKGLQTSYI